MDPKRSNPTSADEVWKRVMCGKLSMDGEWYHLGRVLVSYILFLLRWCKSFSLETHGICHAECLELRRGRLILTLMLPKPLMQVWKWISHVSQVYWHILKRLLRLCVRNSGLVLSIYLNQWWTFPVFLAHFGDFLDLSWLSLIIGLITLLDLSACLLALKLLTGRLK